jgi:preprotein translocase subunit SecB
MRDKYLSFLKSISLQGIGLDSASVNIDRIELTAANEAKQAAELTLDANFQILASTDTMLVAGANFKLSQAHTDNPEKVLMQIECSFSALFALHEPATAEATERFANAEAKLVFWPYLRHFVSDVSYRMAVAPILLPLTTSAEFGRSRPAK